jgi:hypothetical protein
MSFDFFNASSLAFGSKLTAAFKQLDSLYTEAADNIKQIIDKQEILKQYINRNYQVPEPNKPTNACRTNEVFNLIKGRTIIKDLRYDLTDKTLTMEFVKHSPVLNRITRATGSTTLESGYCFYKVAPSNAKVNTEIRFSETNDKKSDELFLIRFEVDTVNKSMMILDGYNELNIYPLDFSQYTGISLGDALENPHTAKGYECLLIVGNEQSGLLVKKNDVTIFDTYCWGNRDHVTIYVKPDDVISGRFDVIKRLNYITT